MKLSRSISTWTLLTSAVAGIVGSGWLLGPLACARIAGPAAVLTWIIGGVLMMIVAATFVLLVRAIPITGGTVRFFQLSYGHFAGFSFSWIAWLAWLAVSPIETMALIQYSSNYIPGLMTQGADTVLTPLGLVVAVGVMAFIVAINHYGMRVYAKLNLVILLFKLVVPVVTVGLLLSTQFHVENFGNAATFMPYGIHSVFAALPLAGVIYSFIGFNPAIQLAAETKNPKRAIPIAIFGALAICMVLYTGIQIAFIGALPTEFLSQGWQQLSFSGDNGPFVGLLVSLGFIWFIKALYIDAAVSPFGTAMVQSVATGRLTYAMGQNGYLPNSVMRTNQHHTPMRAMMVNLLIGVLFFLPFPSWQHMVGFLVSCLVLGYIVGPMSLAILSRSQPDKFTGLSPLAVQVLCVLAFSICNLMILWSGWNIVSKIVLLFIVGYVVLAIKVMLAKGNRAREFSSLDITRGSWVIAYLIGMSMISYCSSFGGINAIPFGIDFIAVAMFSVAIYGLARYLVTRQPISIEAMVTES